MPGLHDGVNPQPPHPEEGAGMTHRGDRRVHRGPHPNPAGPHWGPSAPQTRVVGSTFCFTLIVSFEPSEDGFGIMRGTQTAKPQAFRTSDSCFVYNLATNLAHIQP